MQFTVSLFVTWKWKQRFECNEEKYACLSCSGLTKQDHLLWCLTLSSSSFETRNNDRDRQHRSCMSRTDRSGWYDSMRCTTILLHTRKHNCNHRMDHCHDRMLWSSSRYETHHPSFHRSWRHTHLPSIRSRVSCSSRLHSPQGMCRIPLNTTNRSPTWIPSSVCMERCSSSCEPSPIPSRSFHRAFQIQPYILPRIGWSSEIHRSFVGTRSSCEHGSPWIDRRKESSCWWTDCGRHKLEWFQYTVYIVEWNNHLYAQQIKFEFGSYVTSVIDMVMHGEQLLMEHVLGSNTLIPPRSPGYIWRET